MKKIERFIVYPLLIALMILFSFKAIDLSISETLFNPSNVFGKIGETIGEIIAFLPVVLGLAVMFRFRPRDKKWMDIFFGIVFMLLFVAFCMYAGHHFLGNLCRVCGVTTIHGIKKWLLSAPIAVVYAGFGMPCAFFLVKKEDGMNAFRYAMTAVLILASCALIMEVMKRMWIRPRFRTLMAAEESIEGLSAEKYFKAWWDAQIFNKNRLEVSTFNAEQQAQIAKILGIAEMSSDEFKSFPSGHTMNSVSAMSFILLPTFLPKLKGKEWWIKGFIYLWALTVAISRIVRGAHCASDVTMGYLVGFFVVDMYLTFVRPKFESLSFKCNKEEAIE